MTAALALLLLLQPTPWQVFEDAAGGKLSLPRIVMVGTWIGGAAAMAIVMFLCVICPWWAKAPLLDEPRVSAPAVPKWFRPAVAGAMIAGGTIAAPSLGHSLWDDEQESVVWYVLGHHVRLPPRGEIKLKEHTWRRTVFGYSTPNNHIFHNILARSSNAIWRVVAKPRNLQFNEVALRLPAFLSGLFCIAALAFLLKEFAMPGAGVVAAWLLSLQPWFSQHMAFARGYTLVTLFILIAVICWRRALVSGSWLWWAILASCEFLAIWTYPAAVFFLSALNLSLLGLVFIRPSPVNGPARTMISRWFCCSAIAAAGLLPLVAPLVPQMIGYLRNFEGGSMGFPWLANLGSFLVGGAAWNHSSPAGITYCDMQLVANTCGNAVLYSLYAGAAILFVVGLAMFARRGGIEASLAACLFLGPAAHWAYAQSEGVVLWEWYLVYALPFVCFFAGIGVFALARKTNSSFSRAWLPGATVATLLVAFYMYATSPVRAWQSEKSRVAYRESSAAARAGEEGLNTIVFSTTGAPLAYDPAVFPIAKPVDLAILMFQADAQGRRLVANMGQMQNLQLISPGILQLLENKKLFPVVERFPGFSSGADRFVCRYEPRSAQAFGFEGILEEKELEYARSKAAVRSEEYFAGRTKKTELPGMYNYGPGPGFGKEPYSFRK